MVMLKYYAPLPSWNDIEENKQKNIHESYICCGCGAWGGAKTKNILFK